MDWMVRLRKVMVGDLFSESGEEGAGHGIDASDTTREDAHVRVPGSHDTLPVDPAGVRGEAVADRDVPTGEESRGLDGHDVDLATHAERVGDDVARADAGCGHDQQASSRRSVGMVP